ncbi:hypothetical protein PMAYCL1PPCAC_07519 [Pristionchus mayeri]|uniref:Uncharacterized protein n=1 Tax=Pristionchus mayeri TaxID=1317129 RepID=A0AAN4ZA23_9BILA|nr:hypothetical protein PMAYCL1PPCAC_07507 [Pristionchus mayeri]GMR37324.1 hypothetical protein PMAYCL1PPCAC_07519 [Pristionchus mayeri]
MLLVAAFNEVTYDAFHDIDQGRSQRKQQIKNGLMRMMSSLAFVARVQRTKSRRKLRIFMNEVYPSAADEFSFDGYHLV